jgi:putative cardiolipin synthase
MQKMEGVLLALSQHKNIEVKLFNPYRFRKYRAMDMILDLKRINRRMHNKSFIADNQVALIGGRNMTNQYYNVSDNYQFSDVDVMLVGAAVDDIVILLMITGIMNMHIQSRVLSVLNNTVYAMKA